MKHERRRPSVPSHAGPTRRHPTLLAGLLAVMLAIVAVAGVYALIS